MKISKSLILGLFVCASILSYCEEETNLEEKSNVEISEVHKKYGYLGLGVGIPTFFSVKLGHREQAHNHGFEYGIGMTPLVVTNEVHLFGSYLYYPQPSMESQMYVGCGLRGGILVKKKKKKEKYKHYEYVAPGLIFGKEFGNHSNKEESRRFWQAALGFGALTTKGPRTWSSISFTYGFIF